ncbi:TPA: phage tail protein [Streptococcus suis]|nr:phage tail protein [Streptococcus suis]
MIYLFDKDEKLIKIIRKSAVKTALQKYALTTERYVSDRLTVELKGLNADELEQVEYMAIQTMEDAHTFHYFYVAQKFSDELTTLIGVQSGIEELRKSPVYDKRPKNAFARDVITDLLAGTNWQARFVGETNPHSTNFYYTSIFDALKKVCEVWDLEMQFFVEMNGNRIGARYIDFKQRIGETVGKRVVYGHNALQILQEVERTNIFTALIGRGKGEETGAGYGRKITFEDVTWSTAQGKPVNKPVGQKYLELPLMTRQYGIKNADGSMRPKIGFVDFSEEENPEVLIERTYKALIDAARPQLTLKTSSVYLRGVKVGDTIRVVRHDKKLDYDTRIFEITFNRLNNQSSDIKLGDRIGESNEAKAQTIADKAVEQFVNNEFSNFVQNLPDYLPSADGFNNNWYGAEDPTVKYPGKVLINDIWYKPDPEHEGHKIMLRWTGEVWEEILRTYENEALRDRIAEEIAQVNQSMQAQSEEHNRQVANILSKTQSVESLANQAKSDAASAITQALQFKNEAIAEATRLDTVERQATETKLATAKSQAISEATRLVETAKSLLSGQISNVSTDLIQTKEAIKLLATKATVDTLTGRVSSAEAMIQVQADQISQRVKTSDFDQVKQRISTAESSITQLSNRITTEISETKALIPANLGGTNSVRGSAELKQGSQGWSQGHWRGTGSGGNVEYNVPLPSSPIKGITTGAKITSDSSNQIGLCQDGTSLEAGTYTLSVWVLGSNGLKVHVSSAYSRDANNPYTAGNKFVTLQDSSWTLITQTFTLTKRYDNMSLAYLMLDSPGTVYYAAPYIHRSTLPGDWSPAPEDFANELSSVKTTITQTASGVEQLSTSLSATNYKVTTAETKISQLISDVSSKVSQSDYNTLTGRVDSAETAITQNAQEISKRLTSTQVESAITDKGYQTKSDVDNNITGRGYITNSALQPYALSTTVQNLVQETAGSFERQITETRGLIPTEVNQNLFDVVFSDLRATGGASFVQSDDGWIEVTIKNRWSGFHWYYSDDINPSKKQYVVSYEAYLVDTVAETARLESDFGSPDQLTLINKTPKRYTVVLNRPVNIFNYINFVCDSSETGKKFRIRNIKLEEGIVATPYIAPFPTTVLFNAVKDTVDAHKQLIGNGDSISQAIQSANKFERYISSGGDIYRVIETAKGLVAEVSGTNGLKTQVSTLAGSYAIKSLTKAGDVLGQINLNKDGSVKIDGSLVQITGKTYIQDGVITSAKIGKGQIGTAHIGEIDAGIAKIINLDVSNIKGLDAEFIKAKIENAFIEWMKGKTITAQNEAMTIGLNDAFIRFKDNAKIEFQSEDNTLYRTKNGTSAFIHFRDDSYNGVYTAMGVNADNTGTQNDYSSGSFAGVRVIRSNPRRYSGTTVDQVQLVGDEIRMRHGYGYEKDYLVAKWDGGPKIDLMAWLRQFNTNFAHLINITGRGDVIKTF